MIWSMFPFFPDVRFCGAPYEKQWGVKASLPNDDQAFFFIYKKTDIEDTKMTLSREIERRNFTQFVPRAHAIDLLC